MSEVPRHPQLTRQYGPVITENFAKMRQHREARVCFESGSNFEAANAAKALEDTFEDRMNEGLAFLLKKMREADLSAMGAEGLDLDAIHESVLQRRSQEALTTGQDHKQLPPGSPS